MEWRVQDFLINIHFEWREQEEGKAPSIARSLRLSNNVERSEKNGGRLGNWHKFSTWMALFSVMLIAPFTAFSDGVFKFNRNLPRLPQFHFRFCAIVKGDDGGEEE